MPELEATLYDASRLFLVPVMVLILLALAYAIVSLGSFAFEAAVRGTGRGSRPLHAYRARTGGASEDLELQIMRRLEWLRIVSRSAPMLGLVATMIPMGPALLALGNNDGAAVGKNLVVAFSSVILALVAASISFFVYTIRRRWLLEELRELETEGAA
ncbi:MotA/TolQ/ExbB proton channel family protein [Novosphingobium guangzhouense]|uniref:Biopolymer transporter ExbD n=1 Tax=Novosphingobium guangzhouense TaxID=1850347 RepID=A0A2K2FTQ1_9SPHN|nr:MotA/TolQ/ExbB proton channel family protein [Novosphingobium guangzhouense]PNU02148.1 biopolymer transporter ExbD [Novosphingobium guangzhouense]